MKKANARNLSILIPTFNRSEYLSECLTSLLLQDVEGYEVLVRDNNSEDDTKLIVEKYQVEFLKSNITLKYIKNRKNVGFRDNMVCGLSDLSRDYALILMDDDFFICSSALKNLYREINENDNVVISTSNVAKYFVTKASLKPLDIIHNLSSKSLVQVPNYISGSDFFLNAWTKYPPLVLSSVVFDRNKLLESNWAIWSKRAALDVNLYNILSLQGDVVSFDDEFVAYRIHSEQDFASFSILDAFESHSRILDWYRLAKSTNQFSLFTLMMWRVKTVILKDQGLVVRLKDRNNGEFDEYFCWLMSFSKFHFYIMKLFMPCCIRFDRNVVKPRFKFFVDFMCDFRRFLLRGFLNTYRLLHEKN